MQNPAYLQQRVIDSLDELHCAAKPITKGTVYKIPVVFHVLHNNGPENISDEQILDALSILNRDYRLLNQDANNVQPEFQGMPADIEVEFLLATKAPNGQCFKGITRTVNAISNDGSDGGDQVDAIVAGNDVYNGAWPGNRYLNVFICGDIGGAAGYTTKPSGWSATQMTNGIWILHDYVGSIGTSSVSSSRTLTHEVGHWLGLQHLWGDKQCGDDGIQDTPKQRGGNSGDPVFPKLTTCNATPDGEMFMNFMDFTNDASMGLFTEGQKNVMRAQFGANGKRNSFLNSKGLTSAWNNTQVTTNQTSTPQVSIYPNPVINGNISISLNGLDNSGKHFAIVAANGQIVKTGYFNQAKVEVNVSHFPAGIYQVRLTDVGSNLFAKFVKQ